PHTDAQSVVLTGSFDAWTASCHLTKTTTGFSGTAHVPWGEKTIYKFIVDGTWTIANDQPTETDASGNVNNVYVAPPHP
ncbi:carbohydrate-binding module family 48 protein, partial [Laetiporus sulphureus 93-53]